MLRADEELHETTAATATACAEPDAKAKPIVAEVVSVFGKVVLILLKIIAGFIVFGLIMAACALIIGMFALIVGGEGFFTPAVFGNTVSIWIASLGILATLIPIILLIYVLMCLIASRKPGGKTVLAIFLLWLASIIAVSCVAIRENVGDKFRTKRKVLEQVFQSEIVIDGDTTTLERLLEDYDDESVIEEGRKTLHISVPSKSIDITVDKKQGELRVNADGRKVKGATIHWVDAENCCDAEVRQYDNLFNDPDPDAAGKDFLACLNEKSLEVLTGCKVEASLRDAKAPASYQFMRLGYFCPDSKDCAPGHLVFNRSVSLKDSFKPGK